MDNLFPDSLVPFYPLSVADGKNHPLWFTFYIPANTTRGDYSGNITLTMDRKWDELNPVQDVNFNVTLHVYDFKLPSEPTLLSNFGFSDFGDPPGTNSIQQHLI